MLGRAVLDAQAPAKSEIIPRRNALRRPWPPLAAMKLAVPRPRNKRSFRNDALKRFAF